MPPTRILGVLAVCLASVVTVRAQSFFRWDASAGGNGHYYAITPSATNWTQAETYATSLGGHLVSITSAAEQAFVESLLTGPIANLPLWIGLSDAAVEGSFVWSSGEPLGYTRWHASTGEPNNDGGAEDYGTLNWHRAQDASNAPGTWNDTPLNGTTIYGGNTNGPYFAIIEIAPPPGAAGGNLLVNGGFENIQNTFTPNGSGYMNVGPNVAAIPGWSVSGQGLSWIQNANPFGLLAADGVLYLDLTSAADNQNFGIVSQSITTQPGQSYVLSFAVGTGGTTGVYGGTKTVQASAGSATAPFTFTPTTTGNQWKSFQLPFVATGNSTLIRLAGTNAGSGTNYLGLDNASVRAAALVPGPTLAPGPLANSSVFTWPVSTAGTYQMQRSSDLISWSVTGNSITASAATTLGVVFQTSPAVPREFYRAIRLP